MVIAMEATSAAATRVQAAEARATRMMSQATREKIMKNGVKQTNFFQEHDFWDQ